MLDPADAHYDEASVPDYSLPDPLVLPDGTRLTDAGTWTRLRRPQILALFQEHVYGRSPGRPDGLAAQEMPGLEQPITSTIGYHIRPGRHALMPYDWERYMDWADLRLGRPGS